MAIFERASGKWSAQVYDPAVKRAVSVSQFRADRKGTFGTENQARKAVRDAEKEIAKRAGRTGITVGELRELWMAAAGPGWKGRTRGNYEYGTKAFCATHGKLNADRIPPAIAVRWAAENPGTVGRLNTMWNWAADNGLVGESPWKGKVPKRGKRKLRPGFLTQQDIDDMVDVCVELFEDFAPIPQAMVLTSAWTLLRPSELFELRDVDLAMEDGAPVLDVWRAVTEAGIDTTKKDDVRKLPLAPQAHRAILAARPVRDGMAVSTAGSPLLFVTARGTQWKRPAWQYRWNQIRAAIKRPDLDYYALRHFGATWLLEQGVSMEDVAAMLGHRDGGKLAAQVYTHPDEKHARARLRDALASGPKRTAA